MPRKDIRARHYLITRYWARYYATGLCTLCANIGIIDTRGIKTPAGTEVGRLNWCICPNGQLLRSQMRGREPWSSDVLNQSPCQRGELGKGDR